MWGNRGTLEAFGFKSAVLNKKSRPNDDRSTDEEGSGADDSQVFQKPVANKKRFKNKSLTEFSWLRVDPGKMFCL